MSGLHQELEGIDGGMEMPLERIRREILCESHTCNKMDLDLKHDKGYCIVLVFRGTSCYSSIERKIIFGLI